MVVKGFGPENHTGGSLRVNIYSERASAKMVVLQIPWLHDILRMWFIPLSRQTNLRCNRLLELIIMAILLDRILPCASPRAWSSSI